MGHDTLENSVIVSENNSIWSEKEREEIIDRALEIYLSKRRIATLSSEAGRRAIWRRFDIWRKPKWKFKQQLHHLTTTN